MVRLYLDYLYGIEGCLEDLELSEILELVQFVADDGKADWSSFDAKLWDDLISEIESLGYFLISVIITFSSVLVTLLIISIRRLMKQNSSSAQSPTSTASTHAGWRSFSKISHKRTDFHYNFVLLDILEFFDSNWVW